MEETTAVVNLSREEQKLLVHFAGFFAVSDQGMFYQSTCLGFTSHYVQDCCMTKYVLL